MAKTIQEQLAEKIKAKFPDAEVKKINQDNYVDIHLPGVHPKRGTHLFFNSAGGAIKLGFYCREEEFTQQVLAKNENLEAYSQGVRPKGNPEWRKVDAACDAAFAFVESLTGFATQSSSKTPRPGASGNAGSTLLQRIKAAYPKCSINEEKGYASFTFKSAFLYELRIQKDAIRLLAANYPQKASVAKCFDLIARHDLFIHKIQDRYPVIVEPGKVSPDKLTVRIEIPYQGSDLENESFSTNLIATCEQFHEAVAPLINGFQAQPVGTLREVMGDGTSTPTTSGADPKKESPVAAPTKEEVPSMFDLTEFDEEGRPIGMRDPSGPSQPENSEEDELSLEAILSELESQLEEEEETADVTEEDADTEEEDDEELKIEDIPYETNDLWIDEVNKTVEMSVFHQVLFLILYVGGKTENHTDEEIADVSSTAVTMGVWFDKDEDEGLEVLEETFEVLQKCGELFTTEEILKIADECCFSIHDDVTNADAQKDIIRFITDQANADGELDLWEETMIDSWSLNITIGRGWGN